MRGVLGKLTEHIYIGNKKGIPCKECGDFLDATYQITGGNYAKTICHSCEMKKMYEDGLEN